MLRFSLAERDGAPAEGAVFMAADPPEPRRNSADAARVRKGMETMKHCAIVGINWGDEGKGRMVLGLLLGNTMEKNMRRALTLSKGDWSYFVSQPISCVILVLVVVTFCLPFVLNTMKKRKDGKSKEA